MDRAAAEGRGTVGVGKSSACSSEERRSSSKSCQLEPMRILPCKYITELWQKKIQLLPKMLC